LQPTTQSMSSIGLDSSAESLVAVGISKLCGSKYEFTSGASELSMDNLKGSDVVDFLVKENSSVLGSDEKEQDEVKAWLNKKTNIGELNKHLTLRVYIADGLNPTLADLKVFASMRDQIAKQKAPQRNQFVNVTRWFNHLQPLFEPHFPSVAIKLVYTPPPVSKIELKTLNTNI